MLSPDSLFPDCQECGTNVFVSRDRTVYTFRCHKCDHAWIDEEFELVFDLPTEDASIYIRHEQGGYSFEELAYGTEYDVDGMRRHYRWITDQVKHNATGSSA